jgi:hypothetical protein
VTVRVSAEIQQYLSNVFVDAIVKKNGEGEEAHEVDWSTWQLVFRSFDEARGRILALGGAVEVVEPLPLKLSVIDFAQQIAGLYKGD